ncbi:MAG: hypothetical protein KBA62_06010 [Polaromonas sp.]|jgi:hypothetical protein|nr:hypothetical protein [Polaromonas sp.]MBP7115852.1 hypothetical protein [Polaromonas sp.]MBP7308873.1 hypothetical protein [Polaromonas sp.]MBP8873825.1 hypothetical protein [Polaromonas sp.]MBP9831105.1 hypothetical protein [Polaromonas sp.]
MNKEMKSVPSNSKGDVLHAITKAGLSAIPIVGGPAVELFQYVVQPPLEKRRFEWMTSIGEKLNELEENKFDLEKLKNDENFISVMMNASQMALRTHQEEKLDALRNAILNVAKGEAPDESVQHLFLNFVDFFTAPHLRILKVFQAPKAPPSISMGGLSNVLEFNIPELKNRTDIYDQFWRDLYSRGLVNTDSLHTMMSNSGLSAQRTTNLGNAFLKFIEKT